MDAPAPRVLRLAYEPLDLATLSEHLHVSSSLERIELTWCRLGPEHAALLSTREAPTLAVRALVLDHNDLGDEGVEALCAGAWPALEALSLARCGVTARGFRRLAASPLASRLRELSVDFNELGAEVAEHLSAFGRLEVLTLRETEVGDDAVLALAQLPLRVLNLEGNGLTSRAVTGLSGAPFAGTLEQLLLNDNELDDDGLEVLLRALNPDRLRWLSLAGNPFSDEAVVALSRAPSLAGLDVLEVEVSHAAREAFVRSSVLRLEVVEHALAGTIPG